MEYPPPKNPKYSESLNIDIGCFCIVIEQHGQNYASLSYSICSTPTFYASKCFSAIDQSAGTA